MKTIDLKLSLPVVAPLLDLMKQAGASLKNTLAAPLRIEDIDPDFREFWTAELMEGQTAELTLFFALFNDAFYANGVVRVCENKSEPILRACTALRLELRRSQLAGLSDALLESGGVDVETLAEPQRSSFLAYVFLATMQELIIQKLEGGEDAE